MNIDTNDGSALVFNLHISPDASNPSFLPSREMPYQTHMPNASSQQVPFYQNPWRRSAEKTMEWISEKALDASHLTPILLVWSNFYLSHPLAAAVATEKHESG